MPVEITWLQPNHIILSRFYGDVIVDDLSYQHTESTRMSEAVMNTLVHHIVDSLDVNSFPTSIKAYKEAFTFKGDNVGWVILVGDNKLVRFMTTLVTSVMKVRVVNLSSVDDALEFLQQRDRTVISEGS